MSATDLISRQAAIEALIDTFTYIDPMALIEVISKVPSARPGLIRCKDCKQYRRWIDTDICFCDRNESNMMPDDFCSYGERREDEQTD